MKKEILSAGLIVLISLSACTKSIRYSPEEIKNFPPSIQEKIKNSEIAPGMTNTQVRYSWGEPDEVIVLSPGKEGRERIEWVYKESYFYKSRLIFTDGILTEVITSGPRGK